jgi:hypothetical protein
LDLAPYIRELILSNECVILRGVGGFETSYQHAVYNKTRKVISPPSKQIQFHEDWIKDNGVLENYLSTSLNISAEEASDRVDIFVQEFFNELREKGSVSLRGTGEFFLDDKSRIQFRQLEDANYLADSFGLDILNLDPETKIPQKAEELPLAPIVPQRRKRTGWYIAGGVLLLVISVTLIIILSEGSSLRLFNFLDRERKSGKDEMIVFGNPDLALKDSVVKIIEKDLDSRTRAREALNPVTPDAENNERIADVPAAPVITAEGTTYYLVAGSFRTIRSADILKEQLTRKGFEAETIDMGANVRVIVGKYSNRKLALDELRRMRQQLDQSVWLLEAKY